MTAKVRWLGWILAYHPDLTIGWQRILIGVLEYYDDNGRREQ